MAGTLNDVVMQVTGGPTYNDGLRSYYIAQGGAPVAAVAAAGGSLADIERAMLQTKGATFGPINDMWMQYLSAANGALSDRMFGFWNAGGFASGPPATDPLFAFVTSLLHFEGANASTAVADVKGNAWTSFLSWQLTTTNPLVGTSSGLWNGVSSYIETAHATWNQIDTGDFCIEGFINVAGAADRSIIAKRNTGTIGWALESKADGALTLRAAIDGWSDTKIASAAGLIVAGTKYHWALIRNGVLFSLCLGGNQIGSFSSASGASTFGGGVSVPMRLGRSQSAIESPYNGRQDEFRMTKGNKRYTIPFTPPTGPVPDSA